MIYVGFLKCLNNFYFTLQNVSTDTFCMKGPAIISIVTNGCSRRQELEAQAQEQGDDIKINPATVVKPLHRVIADHKDVIKIVVHLNSVMATLKPQVMERLASYSKYSELWDEVSFDWTI